MRVELGQRVKCRVTGIEGIATLRMQSAGRFDQIHIQPRSTDNSKVEDGIMTDEVNCVFLDNGVSEFRIEPNEHDFEFGDHVIDPYSMMKGTVAAFMISMNGCIEIAVQPMYTEKWTKAVMIPDTRLMHFEDFQAQMELLQQQESEDKARRDSAQISARVQAPQQPAREPAMAMEPAAMTQTPPTAPAPGFLRRTADRMTGAHHGKASFTRG